MSDVQKTTAANPDWLQRAVDALEALRDLDAALSNLWREGPLEPGHPRYLGAIDDAWRAARAVLREGSDAR